LQSRDLGVSKCQAAGSLEKRSKLDNINFPAAASWAKRMVPRRAAPSLPVLFLLDALGSLAAHFTNGYGVAIRRDARLESRGDLRSAVSAGSETRAEYPTPTLESSIEADHFAQSERQVSSYP
jgi:hypothetical protein